MKKILSFVLVLVLMLSCLAVTGVSAAEDTTIYFQVPEDWNNYKNVFCYIWEYDGDTLMGWQVKAGKCEDLGDKLYSYDVSKVGGLEEGKTYCVIFSVNTGIQTYDMFLSTDCYGDTAYCDGTKFENPADSNKTAIAAYWKNQDKTLYGPAMGVTSIGNVVGSCLAPDETAEGLFTKFITGPNLLSAQASSGKDDQAIIDDLARDLGLSADTVEALIAQAGVELNWDKANSAPASPDEATKDEDTAVNLYLGDADLSGGTITVKDATIIQKHIAGFEVAIELICADVDQNDAVNVKDATTIQKFIAGLPVDAAIGLLLGTL
ncbi:MAG: starch-binding protein [Ruminococcus sp.]|nr:starch-binding protein [Ruminococcus sp.]